MSIACRQSNFLLFICSEKPLGIPVLIPPIPNSGRDALENSSLMMNVFLWNCRGAEKVAFLRNMKELMRLLRPAILIVVEPRISGVKAMFR